MILARINEKYAVGVTITYNGVQYVVKSRDAILTPYRKANQNTRIEGYSYCLEERP